MKIIRRLLISLLVLVLVLCVSIYLFLRSHGMFRDPVYDIDPPKEVSITSPAVLVFDKTNGFIAKKAIVAANDMLDELAKKNHWAIYHTDNAAIYNTDDLRKFKAVVWNNVSGDVLTESQRQALKDYISNGGGYVGLHSSGGDPEYAWEWYVKDLLKAQFKGHTMFPQKQSAILIVEAPEDPIVEHLPARWRMEDEWYSFEESPRPGVEVLVSIDEKSYSPRMAGFDVSMGSDHPMIWKHCVGQGRAFYSALGHYPETYQDVNFTLLIERAISWAGGMSGVGCSPAAMK